MLGLGSVRVGYAMVGYVRVGLGMIGESSLNMSSKSSFGFFSSSIRARSPVVLSPETSGRVRNPFRLVKLLPFPDLEVTLLPD